MKLYKSDGWVPGEMTEARKELCGRVSKALSRHTDAFLEKGSLKVEWVADKTRDAFKRADLRVTAVFHPNGILAGAKVEHQGDVFMLDALTGDILVPHEPD